MGRILKAAEQGDPLAQWLLAAMYAMGEGVRRNRAKAMFWCNRAAAGGTPEAQFMLGLMYRKGVGVRRNLMLAYHWLQVASRAKVPEVRRDAAEERDRLEKRMAPRQVALAQRLARNWKPQGGVEV